MLKAGIVGLPNVGKSTLFNAITKAKVLAANYPFATIEPNVGVVLVQDERLDVLEKIIKPQRVLPTTFEFTDIAGLVEGASKGEGLGNQFLSHIREVDAICHVIRCFDDELITHVSGTVDPVRDIEIIKLELSFADLESIDRRLPRLAKGVKTKDKNAILEFEVLTEIKSALENDLDPRNLILSEEGLKLIKNFNLLSLKPAIYVANIAESELVKPTQNEHYNKLVIYARKDNIQVIPISAQVEMEIAHLEPEEQTMFLSEYGLEKSGLNELIMSSYDILGLKTYFTAGEKEVRAWTFKDGMKAPECAGIIHTDFEKGFIRAETISYDDLVNYGSRNSAREAGKVRLEGKDYVVKDGDIMNFRFNV